MGLLFDESETDSGEKSRTAVAVVLALVFTGGVLGGYLYLRKIHAERELQKQAALTPPPKPVPSPQMEITEDEPRIKGTNAQVSGRVKNISSTRFEGINIDFALTKRDDGSLEGKKVEVTPANLNPGEEGQFSFTVSRDYKAVKVSSVRAGNATQEIAFKSVQGSKRPFEGPPETKTVIVKRPNTGSGKDDFINTPDNPSKVP